LLSAVLFAVGCSWVAAGAAWSQTESASVRSPWRDPFPPVGSTPLAASTIAQPAAVPGAPHLHRHVTDGASNATATSSGKPWVVTGFRLVGTLLNEEQWLNQEVVVPAQIGPVAAPIDRQNQLPLLADVVVFP
jgi:hypothetical protein